MVFSHSYINGKNCLTYDYLLLSISCINGFLKNFFSLLQKKFLLCNRVICIILDSLYYVLISLQSPQDYPPNQPDHREPQPGHEPLYAQVKKGHKRPEDDMVGPENVMLESRGAPPGGADSWVQ